MRLQLNGWQRGLLLLASIGILLATYIQYADYGFGGIGWVVPVGLAIAIAFVGVSDLQPKYVAKSQFDPSNPKQVIAAMERCSEEINSHIPVKDRAQKRAPEIERQGQLGLSSIATRATIYGYVLAHIAAIRVNPEFDNMQGTKAFHEAYGDLFRKAWLRRLGNEVIEIPDGQASIDYMLDAATGVQIQTEVHNRMASRSPAPFQPLYAFIDGQSGASDQDLEAKYGPVTRKLLLEILGRTK